MPQYNTLAILFTLVRTLLIQKKKQVMVSMVPVTALIFISYLPSWHIEMNTEPLDLRKDSVGVSSQRLDPKYRAQV